MCGIAGWIGKPIEKVGQLMLEDLQHRGPDASGDWLSADKRVWLGHRRLSIIDLDAAANQPMQSPCGRYTLVFNGEIYNYALLRGELKDQGCSFRTESDTEVLLQLLMQHDAQIALQKINGMFAFALWDDEEKTLLLARDRMGEKPLYVAQKEDQLAFASELTALRKADLVDEQVDPNILAYYFRYLCVPRGRSIFPNVVQIPPGHFAKWKAGQAVQTSPYWDVNLFAHSPSKTTASFSEAAVHLEELLSNSIGLRMQSDVPYGAFLSGGLDSSTVVALMQKRSSKPIKTFTIGFEEESHNEAPYAEAIAKHLGTDHTTIPISAKEIMEHIPTILAQHDEPFADNSSIPTSLLCEHTRKHVTVALSGDGGDELFAGYPRYFWAERITRMQGILGAKGAALMGNLLQHMPHERAARLGGYLATNPEDVYPRMVAVWQKLSHILEAEPTEYFANDVTHFERLAFADEMMLKDQLYYLPDDILTKMDRMSMAHSLEARVPMLDHRVVEYAWQLPLEYKCAARGDKGKLLLRAILAKHVPAELSERPKKGFGLPLDSWLRTSLRDWVESHLNSRSLRDLPHVKPQYVLKLWEQHLRGKNNFQKLWTVLAYAEWCKGLKER